MLNKEEKAKNDNRQNQGETYNFRTDLAVERRDIFKKSNNLEEIDGIETEEQEINENLKVSRVKITNENGEQAIGKPKGDYITIDIKGLKYAEEEEIQKAAETLSSELKKIVDNHIEPKDDILVVGLGNMYVTPDSLGPKVINDIDVTRHIIKYLPQYVEEGTRMVSAISPGVLGTTGIETVEILKGIAQNIFIPPKRLSRFKFVRPVQAGSGSAPCVRIRHTGPDGSRRPWDRHPPLRRFR